jgi:Tfp pilus assembly protein PilN
MGINLLPASERRKNLKEYYFRFFAVLLMALAAAVLGGTLLFLPSYFLSSAEASASSDYLAALKGGKAPEPARIAELAAFTERVSILKNYSRPPTVGRVFALATGDLPQGVYLSSLQFTPNDSGGAVSLAGIASTRQALLDYTAALQKESAFSGVSVPVSALAGDKNIPFSLAFTFTSP